MALPAGLNSLHCCLSFIPLGLCARFFFFLFSGGNLFPLLSSPKGFPSASDYLWLQLVRSQPSGPVWRLHSLFSPQTALREGWRGERKRELGGQTLQRARSIARGWVLADTAIQSQETQRSKSKRRAPMKMWLPILALVCFCNGYRGSEEIIFHCYYKADLHCVGL